MTIQTIVREAAEKLFHAEKTAKAIDSLSAQHPELTAKEAYEIQLSTAAHYIREGKRIVGYKVGLTSRELQMKFGVSEPDYGHLFDSMAIDQEGEIELTKLIAPRIEGELAFVMGKDLKGPGLTVTEVISAIDYVTVSMEIVDCRIRDWKINHVDLIADNGASSRFVLSGAKHRIEGKDFATMGMVLYKNGEVWDTGSGAAVMGNPITAVARLANQLGLHDRGLKAGEVVLSGAFASLVPVAANDYFRCEIGELGATAVRFVKGSEASHG